ALRMSSFLVLRVECGRLVRLTQYFVSRYPTAPARIYTLSLHDALPISVCELDLGALFGLQRGRDRDACVDIQPPDIHEGAAVVTARQRVTGLARLDVQGAVVDDPAAVGQVDRAALPEPGRTVADQITVGDRRSEERRVGEGGSAGRAGGRASATVGRRGAVL